MAHKKATTTYGKRKRAPSTTGNDTNGYIAQSTITNYFSPTTSTPTTSRLMKRSTVKGKERQAEEDKELFMASRGSSSEGPSKRMREKSIVDLTGIADTQVEMMGITEPPSMNTSLLPSKDVMGTYSKRNLAEEDARTPAARIKSSFPYQYPPSTSSTLFPTPFTLATPSKRTFEPTPKTLSSTPFSLASPLALLATEDGEEFVPCSQISSSTSPKRHTPSPRKSSGAVRPKIFRPSFLDTLRESKGSSHLHEEPGVDGEIIPDSASSSPERPSRTGRFLTFGSANLDVDRLFTPKKPTSQVDLFTTKNLQDLVDSTEEDFEVIPSSQSQYLSSPPGGWVYGRHSGDQLAVSPLRVGSPARSDLERKSSPTHQSVFSQTQEESYAPWAKRLLGVTSVVESGTLPGEISRDDARDITLCGVTEDLRLFTNPSPSKSSQLASQTQDESLLPWLKEALDRQKYPPSSEKGQRSPERTEVHNADDSDDMVDITAVEHPGSPMASMRSSSPTGKWNQVFSFDPGNVDPSQYTIPSPVGSIEMPTESLLDRILEDEVNETYLFVSTKNRRDG